MIPYLFIVDAVRLIESSEPSSVKDWMPTIDLTLQTNLKKASTLLLPTLLSLFYPFIETRGRVIKCL